MKKKTKDDIFSIVYIFDIIFIGLFSGLGAIFFCAAYLNYSVMASLALGFILSSFIVMIFTTFILKSGKIR